MVFAGRERITATFEVNVDKIEKKVKKVEGLVADEDSGMIEIDFSSFSKVKGDSGIEIA
jgi:hypothetical protein